MMIISSCCLSTVIHTCSSGLSYFQCHKGLSVKTFLWMLCFPLFDFKWPEPLHSFLGWWVFDLSMPCVCFFQSSDRCQHLTNGCCYLGLLEAFKVGCVTSNRKTGRITEMQNKMILYSLTKRKLLWNMSIVLNAFIPAENKSQGWIRTSW